MPRLLAAFFPSFPLQVAVRAEPALRLRKDVPAFAVADVEHEPGREPPPNVDLLAVSAAARRAGIRPGMTVTQARVLSPGILLRARDGAAHEAAHIAVAEVLSGFGPRVEVVEDRAFGNGAAGWVDVSGETAAREESFVRDALAHLKIAGFAARVAIASERFTARALAEHRRSRSVICARGASRDELASLPASALAAILGSATKSAFGETRRALDHSFEAFDRLGLATLGQIAMLPADTLARRFGAHATSFSALARGEDTTPLAPFRIPEALFEKIDLPSPAETVEPLLFGLKMLVDRVAVRLTGRGRAVSKLLLHLVLEHAPAMALEIRLPRATVATRTILEIARERLHALVLPQPAIEMAVEVVDSIPTRRTQLPLFLDDGTPVDPKHAPPSPEKIAVTLGRLATAFGESAVFAATLADEHRPERAWTPGPLACSHVGASPPHPRLRLPYARGKSAAGRSARRPGALDPLGDTAVRASEALEDTVRPTRVLAAPEPIAMHPPSHGRDAEVDLRGLRRRVASLTGPERLGGGWWDSHPFDRDYFHLTTDDGARFWIYRDREKGGYFLHGLFD